MKKAFLFAITMLYMAVSSGIAMEIHYCMGKKAGVDFYKTEKETCSRCGMKEKKNGCCSDEYKFIKLEDSHKNVSNDISFSFTEAISPVIYPAFLWQESIQRPVLATQNHSPPQDTGPSLCIKNCVFRI